MIDRNFNEIAFNLSKSLVDLIGTYGDQFDEQDLYKASLIFTDLANKDGNFSYFERYVFDNVFQFIDKLLKINDNRISSGKCSIFSKANAAYNQSSLTLIDSIDALTGHLSPDSCCIEAKFNSFLAINGDVSPTNSFFPFELKSAQDAAVYPVIDSISLNNEILKRIFGTSRLKISLKIFYNRQKGLSDGSMGVSTITDDVDNTDDTAYTLNSNLFFDVLENTTHVNKLATNKPIVVSATVLSAILYHNSSEIKTLEVDGQNVEFVRLQFAVNWHKVNGLEQHLACVYWDFQENRWSTYGCRTAPNETGHQTSPNVDFYRVVCFCNHLSNFALLFDPHSPGDRVLSPAYNFLLSTITYTGLAVSSVCYLIMIMTRLFANRVYQRHTAYSSSSSQSTAVGKRQSIFFKSLLNMSQVMHEPTSNRDYTIRGLYLANMGCLLTVNFLFVLLTFVTYDMHAQLCTTLAILLHYGLLVSFCLALGTAVQHFTKLVMVFHTINGIQLTTGKGFLVKWLMVSLLVPVPFVVSNLAGGSADPIGNGICWLRPPHLYTCFVVPLCLLLCLALVLYVLVVVKVYSAFTYDRPDCLKSACAIRSKPFLSSYNHKRVVSLLFFSLCSLSLGWLFGLALVLFKYDNIVRPLFEFLFCLFNSFHGVCLLVGQYQAQKHSRPISTNISPISTTYLPSSTGALPSRNQSIRECLSEQIVSQPSQVSHVLSFQDVFSSSV
jgi:hypothetical protein